jgi:hypothetical protein
MKCERCWHYRDDVGLDIAHPTLCGRCTSNLFGSGESEDVWPDGAQNWRTPGGQPVFWPVQSG